MEVLVKVRKITLLSSISLPAGLASLVNFFRLARLRSRFKGSFKDSYWLKRNAYRLFFLLKTLSFQFYYIVSVENTSTA